MVGNLEERFGHVIGDATFAGPTALRLCKSTMMMDTSEFD
jgi:hypothetical protein